MPRGGARRGAGRKASLRTRLTAKAVAFAEQTGETPLAFMLTVMRNRELPIGTRLQAAGLAATFVHPRLSATLHSTMPSAPSDARERIEAMIDRLAAPSPLIELPAVQLQGPVEAVTVVEPRP